MIKIAYELILSQYSRMIKIERDKKRDKEQANKKTCNAREMLR